MEDTNSIDFRALQPSVVRREKYAEMEPALEAFTFAWRPAGSTSLGERWLRAGEDKGVQQASPGPTASIDDFQEVLRPRT